MSNYGLIISAVVIGAGLIWLLIRSITGREVERRIIFLFVGISVSVPLLFNITFFEKATPVVKAVYDKIENLPSGSKVLISFDYGPNMAPEVQPMSDAFIRHSLAKNHKLFLMGLWATGQSLSADAVDRVIRTEFPEKINGVDYINIGYKAGNQGVLNVIITDFRKLYLTDVDGVNLDSTEIFRDIKSLKDMDLLISVGGGFPGIKEWVLFAADPGNIPTAGGSAAVSSPLLYPYYPNQLLGLLGGIKGAAEYEAELKRNYPQFADMPVPGLEMMGPQTLAHMIIMAFIVIGNLSFFFSRRKRR
jgi:hypothetical protein